ncbi:peptidase of plants and bacteria-domain-containing protein, partial [Geopyxis carbonaria]
MATTPATLHAPPAPPAAPPTTAPSPAAPQPTSILVLDTSSKKPHPSKSKKKPKKPKPPRETWHIPVLRLELHDLAHAGTQRFLTAGLDLSTLLKTAVTAVLSRLYASPAAQPAKVKTLKLVVRAMDTLAYTTGTARAKEIHLSSSYLAQLTLTGQALADEILGVVRHEMVHVWQHNGRGAAPGGLVEGIADWVRMRDGLVPAHWSRGGRRWDEGYQVTAYFLEWLEDCYGEGTMRAVNEGMKGGYDEEALWAGVSGGKTVGTLWGEY